MEVDVHGIYVGDKSKTIGAKFHENRGKPALLRKLKEDPTHQINWETPYYTKFIDKCLDGMDFSDKVFLDLGCGDGRFTEYLINKGVKQVVCVDSDYKTLYELMLYSEENGFRDKIKLINCGAENVPLDNNSIDVILALGVFYYLGDEQQKGIKSMCNILKDGGMLISSEPTLEGIGLRSLIFNDIYDMVDNFNSNTFKEEQGDSEYRFPLHDKNKILSLYSDSGFKLDLEKGLSIFHQFIRIMYVRGMIKKTDLEENLENLRKIFDYLDDFGDFNKTMIYKHIKQ
jgi:SAM-dependent methyltransferase